MARIAVVGATGLVGTTILEVLQEREVAVDSLRLLASPRSAGRTLPFRGEEVPVAALDERSFDGIDIAFFSAGGSVSQQWAPVAAAAGAVVIDNTSAFRMTPGIPLVVPEVNPEHLAWVREQGTPGGIIANPNCSTIQSVVALAPLVRAFGARRVVYSTYQAVSGSGASALRDLDEGLGEFYPRPIERNVLPHIDVFGPDGYTKEETKMMNETRKILDLPQLRVTATTVRVPVRYGHAVAVSLETERACDPQEARRILAQAPGVTVVDDPQADPPAYPTPLDAQGRDDVLVGRVRADLSVDHGLALWVVADNIRKGAATNAVQIAERLAETA